MRHLRALSHSLEKHLVVLVLLMNVGFNKPNHPQPDREANAARTKTLDTVQTETRFNHTFQIVPVAVGDKLGTILPI